MKLLIELFVQGLATGAMYAMIGVSFGIIFNVSQTFHFAYGAIYVLAAYVVYALAGIVTLPAAIAVAAIYAATVGAACELFVYRPFRARQASNLTLFLVSFAVLVLASNGMLVLLGGMPRSLAQGSLGFWRIGDVVVPVLAVVKIVTGTVTVALALAILEYSRFGRSLRAVVSSPAMAEVVGIDVRAVNLRAFALGSALAVPPAVISLYDFGVYPSLGETTVLIAAIAVFGGGLGVAAGGAIGGLVLGLVTSMSALVFPTTIQQTISFAVMTILLLLRPNGLVGRSIRRA